MPTALAWHVPVGIQGADTLPAHLSCTGVAVGAEQASGSTVAKELFGARPVTMQHESIVEGGDKGVLECDS